MSIVFKPSENLKEKIFDYYDKYEQKHPDYTYFQVKLFDCTVTYYESGKLMFQGPGEDIEASLWIEEERILNNRIIDTDSKDKKDDKKELKTYNCSSVGSDEVGTGDYFGPIVVTAAYVDKKEIPYLSSLGVRDSKKIDDAKIIKIAPEIINKIPHVSYILDNESYNKLPIEDQNMNKIKAILHNKVLVSLLEKDNYDYKMIVIDQFVYPKKFYEHIKDAKKKITNVFFMTKAEEQVMSVAVASVISRYIFLKEMKKISNEIGKEVPFGAGTNVDAFAKELLNKIGEKELKKYVKYNFKNTQKIMD